MKPKISLLGASGFAIEIINWVNQSGFEIDYLYDGTIKQDENYKDYKISNILYDDKLYIIAVGYPIVKQKILESKDNIKLHNCIIHPSCILGEDIIIGNGSILCPQSILTTDIIIGKCATIGINVTISHNCRIGNLFNASPGANISGNVRIGDNVFIGTNVDIKEKIFICNNVIIGSGSSVISDITDSGVYAGSPARKIK
jgi:sugar O-acyltransferase (sialic acid O-acetyltransferase NeuD family)